MGNKSFFLGSVVFWALVTACSLLWNIYTLKDTTFHLAKNVEQTFFKEIQITRLWNAEHGGVYVPVTGKTQPNPYLDVPNRDITSTRGLKLTLINPAYMTRQIAEIARNEENIQYHITSLKPIRPQNRADAWEIKALTAFEKGGPELMEYLEDKQVFRYIAPLFVKQACLKCHAKQGYKIGDIRGGISVTLPAKEYINAYQISRNKQIAVHAVFFLVGAIALYLFNRFRDRQLAILSQKHIELEFEVATRKRAEEIQHESDEKFRLISEQSLLGISIFQDGVYQYVNDASSQISEYSVGEMMGWKAEEFSKLIHPDDLDFVMDQFRKKQAGEQGYITNYTYRGITKSGKIKWLELYSKPINYRGRTANLVNIIDITERKQSEDLMIQTEKMMSVGGLAAGMAHELNNPLGGILQGIQNVQRRLSPDLKSNHEPAKKFGIDLHDLQSYLEKRGVISSLQGIQESGKKAAQIILNMLQFSRRSDSKMDLTNLTELLENVLELAGKDYDLKKKYDFRTINVIKKIPSAPPLVPCIKTEIEQVVLNLLSNAAWATANKKSDAPSQIILRMIVEKEMVRIEVEDNGPGMNEETQKRIFEPFFTTKPVGEGTGLGLSVSYMIITSHHKGTMEVESELGKGTKFTVLLPMGKKPIA